MEIEAQTYYKYLTILGGFSRVYMEVPLFNI